MKRVDIFSKKYYTDFHDVDEDVETLAAYGGHWAEERTNGMYRRHLNGWANKDYSAIDVASSTVEFNIIRITMMSTKI